MTQYDAIGESYALMKSLPFARVERDNFHLAVGPYVKDAVVLDLACGIGYYSDLLLEWGARKVVGVDVSGEMVEGAKRRLNKWCEKGRFEARVGDGLIPMRYYEEREGEGFDLVTGVWFLNYARSGEELERMFETIAVNLKEGGVYVGITPHPTDDVGRFGEECQGTGEMVGVRVDFTSELESREGWNTHVRAEGTGERKGQTVEFDNYHLKKSVFEEAARRGGMKGELKWRSVRLPETAEDRRGFGLEDSQWEYVRKVPYFGVLVVRKC